MRSLLVLLAALAVLPLAHAQGSDPTVNGSDFDTSVPTPDTSYLGDAPPEKSTPGFELALVVGAVAAVVVARRT